MPVILGLCVVTLVMLVMGLWLLVWLVYCLSGWCIVCLSGVLSVWLVYCLSAPHVTVGPVLKGPTVYLVCLLGLFLLASVLYL